MKMRSNLSAVNSRVNFFAIYLWIAYNKCKGDDDYAKYQTNIRLEKLYRSIKRSKNKPTSVSEEGEDYWGDQGIMQMKKDLIKIMQGTEQIKTKFHSTGGQGMPIHNIVYDDADFALWKQ